MSNQKLRLSTYSTSRSSFCSRVKAPRPLIWASPVSPGLTRSLRFWFSFHSAICETYKGLGPTSDICPTATVNNCGSSSSDRSRRNRPARVSRGSSGDFGLAPKGSTSVVMVRNLYRANGFPPRPALSCLNTAGPLLESLTSRAVISRTGDRIIKLHNETKISKLLLKNAYINLCSVTCILHRPACLGNNRNQI